MVSPMVTECRRWPLIKAVACHNMMDGRTGPVPANDHTTSSFKGANPGWIRRTVGWDVNDPCTK